MTGGIILVNIHQQFPNVVVNTWITGDNQTNITVATAAGHQTNVTPRCCWCTSWKQCLKAESKGGLVRIHPQKTNECPLKRGHWKIGKDHRLKQPLVFRGHSLVFPGSRLNSPYPNWVARCCYPNIDTGRTRDIQSKMMGLEQRSLHVGSHVTPEKNASTMAHSWISVTVYLGGGFDPSEKY